MTDRQIIRLNAKQGRALLTDLSVYGIVRDVQRGCDPGFPLWTDIESVTATGLEEYLVIRFPGWCAVRDADRDENHAEGGDGYAQGTFVITFDPAGDVAFIHHSGVGRLTVRHGVAVQT